MTNVKYKVLTYDMKSPFQQLFYNKTWEIGVGYHCLDFNRDESVSCGSGYYATDIEGIIYTLGNNPDRPHRVFECEVWGDSVISDEYKQRYENIKLTREVMEEEYKTLLCNNPYTRKLTCPVATKYDTVSEQDIKNFESFCRIGIIPSKDILKVFGGGDGIRFSCEDLQLGVGVMKYKTELTYLIKNVTGRKLAYDSAFSLAIYYLSQCFGYERIKYFLYTNTAWGVSNVCSRGWPLYNALSNSNLYVELKYHFIGFDTPTDSIPLQLCYKSPNNTRVVVAEYEPKSGEVSLV